MTAVAREYHEYVMAHISRNIFFTDGGFGGVPATGVQVSFGFMIPLNAIILRIYLAVTTAFNAATTNTLDVGTAAAPTALLSAAALTAGVTANFAATLNGLLSNTADTEIFTRYNFTGAAPTAGLGRVSVMYVVDPDRRK